MITMDDALFIQNTVSSNSLILKSTKSSDLKRAKVKCGINCLFGEFFLNALSTASFSAISSLLTSPRTQIKRGWRMVGPNSTWVKFKSICLNFPARSRNLSRLPSISSSYQGGTIVRCKFFPDSHLTGKNLKPFSHFKILSCKDADIGMAIKILFLILIKTPAINLAGRLSYKNLLNYNLTGHKLMWRTVICEISGCIKYVLISFVFAKKSAV